MSRSEREKMLADEPYLASDPELVRARERARGLLARYNASPPADRDGRLALLRELLGAAGEGSWVEPPFFCDYGTNIYFGREVYLNFGCVFLDCNTVHVGEAVKFGPGVHVYAAYHPVDPVRRRSGVEMAAPVRVGDNAWIGGGVIICPGVQIGTNAVIGAGSVVTRDVPPNVVAAGNPCRVLRGLT